MNAVLLINCLELIKFVPVNTKDCCWSILEIRALIERHWHARSWLIFLFIFKFYQTVLTHIALVTPYIWWHKSGSTFALPNNTKPFIELIINGVLWHSIQTNFTGYAQAISSQNEFEILRISMIFFNKNNQYCCGLAFAKRLHENLKQDPFWT